MLLLLTLLLSHLTWAQSFDWKTQGVAPRVSVSSGLTRSCYAFSTKGIDEVCYTQNSQGYITALEQDADLDGAMDLIESYGTQELPQFVRREFKSGVLTAKTEIKYYHQISYLEIIKFSKGKSIERRIKVIKQLEQAYACSPEDFKKFMQTIAAIGPSVAVNKLGFYESPYGLQIHNSCIQKRGPMVVKELSASLERGLSCLQNINTVKSKEHIVRIKTLFESKPKPKIVCNEEKYNWKGVAAHATAKPGEVGHPMISMNPHTCKSVTPGAFQSTFFHEIFHNIGYLHQEDPEYAYACAQCCFENNKTKNQACQMCGGDTKSIRDPKYLENWIALYQDTGHFSAPHEALEQALIENPKNAELLNLKLKLYASPFSAPMASAYIKQYRKVGIPVSEALASDVNFYVNRKYNQPLIKVAEAIAEAEHLAQVGDLNRAVEILGKANIPQRGQKLSLKDAEMFAYAREELEKAQYKAWDLVFTKAMEKENYQVAQKAVEPMKRLMEKKAYF